MLLPTILLVLDLELGTTQLSLEAFRSAIIQRIGFQKSDFFHNHFKEDEGEKVQYRYPLVQYKWIGGQPAMLCLGEAAADVYLLFTKGKRSLNLYKRDVPFRIEKLVYSEQKVYTSTGKDFEYEIKDYIALNAQNYLKYKAMQTPWERFELMEKLLANHLIAVCKGIQYQAGHRLEVQITDFPEPYKLATNEHTSMAFRLRFKTNICLPDYIGMGKDSAKGMGVLREVGL